MSDAKVLITMYVAYPLHRVIVVMIMMMIIISMPLIMLMMIMLLMMIITGEELRHYQCLHQTSEDSKLAPVRRGTPSK